MDYFPAFEVNALYLLIQRDVGSTVPIGSYDYIIYVALAVSASDIRILVQDEAGIYTFVARNDLLAHKATYALKIGYPNPTWRMQIENAFCKLRTTPQSNTLEGRIAAVLHYYLYDEEDVDNGTGLAHAILFWLHPSGQVLGLCRSELEGGKRDKSWKIDELYFIELANQPICLREQSLSQYGIR
ncbi:hypothetical protein CALCODRAFT_531935 [Calocera cornea HHB12733]|uniref:Uncharacterized protein n=1 Tax=Calocera cornea HHB12733 TaxID=1353952 RepID=A0A165D4A7_9BASI|nr:hypothetical protein CALCODRAFT_531935 [Calocera cornea HHB12733]